MSPPAWKPFDRKRGGFSFYSYSNILFYPIEYPGPSRRKERHLPTHPGRFTRLAIISLLKPRRDVEVHAHTHAGRRLDRVPNTVAPEQAQTHILVPVQGDASRDAGRRREHGRQTAGHREPKPQLQDKMSGQLQECILSGWTCAPSCVLGISRGRS